MQFDESITDIIAVERAIDDLRRGLPVCIDNTIICVATETVSDQMLSGLAAFGKSQVNPLILLAGKRLQHVVDSSFDDGVYGIDLAKGKDRLRVLCGLDDGDMSAFAAEDFVKADATLQKAQNLIKLSELIPSTIAVAIEDDVPNWISSVDSEQIAAYCDQAASAMVKLCDTPLTLANAEKSRIVAFRPAIGGREHYAIIVGSPDLAVSPLVRVHSSCYTGDLLASLSCDCRDQLQDAIAMMAQGEGGVVVYLLQEGRGIGLPNKLRAYHQKERGLDTVDANEILGFDDDERLFMPAAQILRELGVVSVRLLSNNPKKAKGLESCGIGVAETVPLVAHSHEHNEGYLKTKADRLGHTF